METFFTSDHHFGHANIIRYCNRPFGSVEEMNEALIEKWNARVSDRDTVHLLGDFCFAKGDKIAGFATELIHRLKGRKVFIPGNHDPRAVIELPYWDEVTPLKDMRLNGHKVTLCHYMMKTWNKAHHGALQLFGHSHGNMAGTSQQCDVGVDAFDYQPVTLDECIERMKTFPKWSSGDHHQYRE